MWNSSTCAAAADALEAEGKSMPEHLLKYRAATFFGRQYVADLLLGIQTEDEIVDIEPVNVTVPNTPHEAAIAQPAKSEVLPEQPISDKLQEQQPDDDDDLF